MSSRDHNNFVGCTLTTIACLGVLTTVNHFTLAKLLESRGIISPEKYEKIADKYVKVSKPPLRSCLPIELYGVAGATIQAETKLCLEDNQRKFDNKIKITDQELKEISAYNKHHSLGEKAGRIVGDGVILLGGAVSIIVGLCGLGHTRN